ncbi:Agrin [Sarcoptes scabiei]|uniref:Agrin n=1 Tax=Sarcoptes scabiei TaxID=52283 RepID=A0A834R4F3_SARSC|nr:Agrin [Sarcoptes scabiei]
MIISNDKISKHHDLIIISLNYAELCRNVVCNHPFQQCQVDENGRSGCVCSIRSICQENGVNNSSLWKVPSSITSVNKEPVCGSDGKYYRSVCELRKYSCQHNLDLVPTDRKDCLKQIDRSKLILDSYRYDEDRNRKYELNNYGKECGNEICHPFALCEERNGRINSERNLNGKNESIRLLLPPIRSCQCPRNCSKELTPICASNNQNYANECEMRRDACLKQIFLQVLHQGQCGRCDPECRFHSKCQLNQQNIPECVCPQVCLRVDSPVCGDNGITYENECELRIASCRLRKQINIRFNSSCDLCHKVVCRYGATCFKGKCICTDNCQNNLVEPLCANDGNTYRNECELNRMACNSKKELIALFYGRCEETNNENFLLDYSSAFQNDFDEKMMMMRIVKKVDEESDNQISSSPLPSPSSLSSRPKFCSEAENDCREEKHLRNALNPYQYVCDNHTFENRCDLIQYYCNDHRKESQNQCENYCQCNRYGVDLDNFNLCDRNRCVCRKGIVGERCDQCPLNFWKQFNAQKNQFYCKPCNCNPMGSTSQACDSSDGTCRCKPGVYGHRCDRCPFRTHLTSHGCVHDSLMITKPIGCDRNRCKFGAICQSSSIQSSNSSSCVCQFNCFDRMEQTSTYHHHHHHHSVCASDGSLHHSICHFRRYVCNLQRRIRISKNCPTIAA